MTEGSDTNTEEAAAKQSPVDAQCQQPINKDEIENASKNDYDNYLVIIILCTCVHTFSCCSDVS